MFAPTKNQPANNKLKIWRTRGFSLLTVIFILALVGAGSFKFVVAWMIRDPEEQVHLWHVAELAALTILLLGGTLLWQSQQPQEKPLLTQFFVLGITILAALFIPFVTQAAALYILLGLFIALYPNFRALLSFSREGPISKLLFGLSLLIAVILLPNAWKEYQWQIAGWKFGEVHALALHWVGSAVLSTLLVLGGFLASTKRPGWRELGIIVGGIYIYLGVIAMVTLDQAGSWGGAGGLFGIIAGAWYIIITLLEAQGTAKKVPATEVEPTAAFEAKPVNPKMALL